MSAANVGKSNGLSILKYVKPSPYSPIIIVSLLVGVTCLVAALASLPDLQTLSFLFFGLPVVYTALIYGIDRGVEIALVAIGCWLIGVSSHLLDHFLQQPLLNFLVTHIVPVSSYLIGCLVLSKLILSERRLHDKYKDLAESYADTAKELAEANQSIRRQYLTTVKALVKAIDAKDSYTSGHSERVASYSMIIANELGLEPRAKRQLYFAAILHDIGKIGIRSDVLNKCERLSVQEFEDIRLHPQTGAEIIGTIDNMQQARLYVLYHHERMDGSGYPEGLAGEAIPLGARIIGVADAFDAMTTQRAYNQRLTVQEAFAELRRNTPTQFDPRLVDTLYRAIVKRGYGLDVVHTLDTMSEL